VRVHFLGVRGSTPAPGEDFVRYGGYTSCVALAHDGDAAPSLLLDAGTGIRRVSALSGGTAFAGTVLLSHLHWDHVHGLPFFTAGDREDALVTLYLPEQPDRAAAADVLSRGMSPPHFPIGPEGLRGNWSFQNLAPGVIRAEGFSVQALEIPHKGGRTYGYRVSDGKSVLTYMPDHCPTVLGPGPDGWGEYHADALELARGCDAIVHDAQLLAEELASAAFLGHAAADYAVELARRAGAGRVVLFHHQPDRTDNALDELPKRFGAEPQVIVAAESLVLEL
jgi:phosphoribosyl 1,2-cyclic phosphodiesterase